MHLVEFPLDDGGRVVVRVDSAEDEWPGVVTRGGAIEDRLLEAQHSFQAAMDPIRAVGQAVLDRLAALDRAPDEARVEFGLELSAKAGAILSAGGTATLKVSLTWRADPAQSRPAGVTGP